MLTIGYILDNKYEVKKILGTGGMSTVYLCENNRLGNLWAIKEVDKTFRTHMDLLAEPNILKNLSHPGIPRVIDIFYENDNLYIVEDFIEGETIQESVERNGTMSEEKIAKISIKLCSILEYLHSFNPPIIYRDLKPSNIMITKNDEIVLIDFGISRTYKEDKEKDTIFMGSKGYAAPEQYGLTQSGVQTDIYGIGATIYFMAIGAAPLSFDEPLKKENYTNNNSNSFINIIIKSMQFNSKDRYDSITNLKKDIYNLLEEKKTQILSSSTINNSFEKTKILDSTISKATLGKNKKKIFLIISTIIILLLSLYSVFNLLNSKKQPVSKEPVSKEVPKSTTQTQDKPSTVTPKDKEIKDIVVQGILNKNDGKVIYIQSDTKSKGKGKHKPEDKISSILYPLAPASSITKNNNFSILLNTIELKEDGFIATITIQNSSDKNITVNKTFNLQNVTEGTIISPQTLSYIPSKSKLDIKVYFKDAELKMNSFSVNGNINNTDVSLIVNIKP